MALLVAETPRSIGLLQIGAWLMNAPGTPIHAVCFSFLLPHATGQGHGQVWLEVVLSAQKKRERCGYPLRIS
jgi:hypothetical protein